MEIVPVVLGLCAKVCVSVVSPKWGIPLRGYHFAQLDGYPSEKLENRKNSRVRGVVADPYAAESLFAEVKLVSH